MQTPDEMAALLCRVPLFSDLDAKERSALQGVLRRVVFRAGELLFRQGAAPDGLYVIAEGRVAVSRRLPGNDEVTLIELGPDEVLGDMALVDRQQRSASARAMADTQAWFLDGRWFDAQRAQLDPMAFKLLRRIALLLCARIRQTNQEMAVEPAPRDSMPGATLAQLAAESAGTISACDQPLLRFLPLFREFSDAELLDVTQRMRRHDARRGQLVFSEGEPGASCFITLRGAVEVSMHRGEKQRLAILGPGKLFGQVALIDGGRRSATCKVRENAVLLELSQAMITQIFAEGGPIAFKLMGILLNTLIGAQRDADASLARLEAFKQARDEE